MAGRPSSRTTSPEEGSRAGSDALALTWRSVAHVRLGWLLHLSVPVVPAAASGHLAGDLAAIPAVEDGEQPGVLDGAELAQEVAVQDPERALPRDLGATGVQ